jgi:hypothetical protein
VEVRGQGCAQRVATGIFSQHFCPAPGKLQNVNRALLRSDSGVPAPRVVAAPNLTSGFVLGTFIGLFFFVFISVKASTVGRVVYVFGSLAFHSRMFTSGVCIFYRKCPYGFCPGGI